MSRMKSYILLLSFIMLTSALAEDSKASETKLNRLHVNAEIEKKLGNTDRAKKMPELQLTDPLVPGNGTPENTDTNKSKVKVPDENQPVDQLDNSKPVVQNKTPVVSTTTTTSNQSSVNKSVMNQAAAKITGAVTTGNQTALHPNTPNHVNEIDPSINQHEGEGNVHVTSAKPVIKKKELKTNKHLQSAIDQKEIPSDLKKNTKQQINETPIGII